MSLATVEDATTTTTSSSSSNTMELYVDSDRGVQLNYPSNWRKWTSAEFEAQGGVVSFTPDAEVSDQPVVSLSLMLYPDAQGMDLDKYTDVSMAQLQLMFNSMPERTTQKTMLICKGKLILGPNNIQLSGDSGRQIEYLMIGAPDGAKHRYLQAWTLRYDSAFILMFSAPMAQFTQYKSLVESSLESFLIRPEAAALLLKQTVQREITSMYGIPFVDKQHGFRIHYPSGWKFHTSRKTSRAVHCEYRGRLSHAPDEKEVLLGYDVTAEPCNTTLEAYSARLRRELAKALGRSVAISIASQPADASAFAVPAVDCDASGKHSLQFFPCRVGERDGFMTRFRTAALNANSSSVDAAAAASSSSSSSSSSTSSSATSSSAASSAASAYFELRWTVADDNAYVLTFVSTASTDDRRAEPLFARLASSFELVPQGYKSKYATRRYENLQLGVRLDYPTNLAVHEKVMGAIVSFVEELPGEEFGSHVNFVSHRLEDMNLSGDLEQFTETIKQQMPSFVQDYAIEDEMPITLGGQSGMRIIYRGRLQPFEAKFAQFFTIKDGRAFILSYAVLQVRLVRFRCLLLITSKPSLSRSTKTRLYSAVLDIVVSALSTPLPKVTDGIPFEMFVVNAESDENIGCMADIGDEMTPFATDKQLIDEKVNFKYVLKKRDDTDAPVGVPDDEPEPAAKEKKTKVKAKVKKDKDAGSGEKDAKASKKDKLAVPSSDKPAKKKSVTPDDAAPGAAAAAAAVKEKKPKKRDSDETGSAAAPAPAAAAAPAAAPEPAKPAFDEFAGMSEIEIEELKEARKAEERRKMMELAIMAEEEEELKALEAARDAKLAAEKAEMEARLQREREKEEKRRAEVEERLRAQEQMFADERDALRKRREDLKAKREQRVKSQVEEQERLRLEMEKRREERMKRHEERVQKEEEFFKSVKERARDPLALLDEEREKRRKEREDALAKRRAAIAAGTPEKDAPPVPDEHSDDDEEIAAARARVARNIATADYDDGNEETSDERRGREEADRILQAGREEREAARRDRSDKDAKLEAERNKRLEIDRLEKTAARRDAELELADKKAFKKIGKRVGEDDVAIEAAVSAVSANDDDDAEKRAEARRERLRLAALAAADDDDDDDGAAAAATSKPSRKQDSDDEAVTPAAAAAADDDDDAGVDAEADDLLNELENDGLDDDDGGALGAAKDDEDDVPSAAQAEKEADERAAERRRAAEERRAQQAEIEAEEKRLNESAVKREAERAAKLAKLGIDATSPRKAAEDDADDADAAAPPVKPAAAVAATATAAAKPAAKPAPAASAAGGDDDAGLEERAARRAADRAARAERRKQEEDAESEIQRILSDPSLDPLAEGIDDDERRDRRTRQRDMLAKARAKLEELGALAESGAADADDPEKERQRNEERERRRQERATARDTENQDSEAVEARLAELKKRKEEREARKKQREANKTDDAPPAE